MNNALRSMRSTVIIAGLAMSLGCSGDPVEVPDQCTTSTAADGTVTIDCGSGGTATLVPPDEQPPLLVSTSDASLDDCPDGGSVIEIGHDLDGDGTLGAEEVEETVTVCDGATGPQGPQGEDGDEGDDGATALINVTAEPAGVNCEVGGQRFDVGIDSNGDGTLDPDEVQTTVYVCDGEDGGDGDDGLVSLVDITEVGPGDDCENSGIRVDTGLDLNNNGELDADEIQHTYFVCNGTDGEDGLTALVTISDELPGENCPLGGHRIDSGLDLNENGELDASEITDTAYVCASVPPYSQAGILHGLSVDGLTDLGWQICHLDQYGEILPELEDLTDCNGQHLMLACRQTDSDTLTVAAADFATVVTKEIPPSLSDHHVSAGVAWYYAPEFSWGFAPAGAEFVGNPCDISEFDDAGDRLCWHTVDWIGGFRCGETQWLNESSAWERVILTF